MWKPRAGPRDSMGDDSRRVLESYKNYAAAEIFSYLPGMQRVGSRTVKYMAKNIAEAVDVIMVAESYQPDVSP